MGKATFSKSCLLALAVLFVAGSATYLSGCGGSRPSASPGGTSLSRATGRAVFTVTWPPRKATGRLIPVQANSIRIDLQSDGKTVQSQLLVRPYPSSGGGSTVGTLAFDGIPVGSYTVIATALPSADGTGTAQATGSASAIVTQGATTDFAVTMATTIDHITIAAANAAVTLPATVTVGQSLALVAMAVDASGATVVANLRWTATDPATGAASTVASVDASGNVTALKAGTAEVTVTDAETGKSASTTVTVVPAPTPTPVPHFPQFSPNDPTYAAQSSGWTANGDAYFFDTDAGTLRDTTKNILIANAQFVTQTFITGRTSVKYAVFAFAGDISLGGGSQITGKGAPPVVLLTQGAFTLSGGAKIDFTGTSTIRPCGGEYGGGGPGSGGNGDSFGLRYSGGGSFGGVGGGPGGTTYGTDFGNTTAPHFQGGSGGSGNAFVDGSGGAIYIASVGTLTINNGTIKADGDGGHQYGGGSGGGIALFGAGGVAFTGATLDASGGLGVDSGYDAGGGGGGIVLVGYGQGTTAPDISFITVNGGLGGIDHQGHYGGGSGKLNGLPGIKTVTAFAGF